MAFIQTSSNFVPLKISWKITVTRFCRTGNPCATPTKKQKVRLSSYKMICIQNLPVGIFRRKESVSFSGGTFSPRNSSKETFVFIGS